MSVLDGDVYVNGNFQARTMAFPAGEIEDVDIHASAGIGAGKLKHRERKVYSEGSTVVATAQTRAVALVLGATALVRAFKVGLYTLMTNGGSDDFAVTFDLQKQDGTSVLNAAVTINKTTNYTAKTLFAAVINGAQDDLVAGNQLYLVITVSGSVGTQGKGLMAVVEYDEDPQ